MGQVLVRFAGSWLELPRWQIIAFELPLIAIGHGTAALIQHWSMGVAAFVRAATNGFIPTVLEFVQQRLREPLDVGTASLAPRRPRGRWRAASR